jgi:ATP-dependent 26S proteasome regulatory subunit
MSKKNKNKEVLNLPIANSITIQMIDPIYPDMTQTPLFKLYIKNSLLNKLLKLNNMFEISLFSKNKSFIITATTVTSESFMLNEESQIKITQIEEEIEKLKISDTKENDNGLNILKNLVENQIKLDSAEFDQTECVGLEEYVEKVQQIFKYTINQSENTKYIYKGIVINGAPGIGKTHLVNSIIKMNYNLFKFLKIDIKELIVNIFNLEI